MSTIVVKRQRIVAAVVALLVIASLIVTHSSNPKITNDLISSVKAYTENVPGFLNPRPEEIDQTDALAFLGDTLEIDPLEPRPAVNYDDEDKETVQPGPVLLGEAYPDPETFPEMPPKTYPKVDSLKEVKFSEKLPFRIYSHNIKNGGNHKLELGEPEWETRKAMVVASIRAHVVPNTVVALQEAQKFQIDDILESLNLLEEPGYQWKLYGAGRIDGKSMGEHVPLLVEDEFDVVYDDTFWLNEKNQRRPLVGWDAKYPRSATFVTLKHKKTGAYFNVFNTHFDHKGLGARVASVQLLMERMEKLNEWPSFLCGDFNARPNEDCYKEIKQKYTDVHSITSPYNWYGHPDFSVTGFTGNYLKDAKRIDYIFAPKSVLKALGKLCLKKDENLSLQLRGYGMLHSKFGGVYMSDHRPLMADFVLKKC